MTTAREEILGRVRRALDRDLGDDDRTTASIDRGYRAPPSLPPGVDSWVDLFAERVEDYRATVHRCTEGEVEVRLAELLGGARVVVPPGLEWAVPHPVDDAGLSATDLDDLDAVVTGAALGIAVTGTIVLTHGARQGRRALTLVPDRHVCVVRESQVVPGVVDAVAVLDPARPQTWISGPSATSDIELDRVEGVHGPRRLDVLLVAPTR